MSVILIYRRATEKISIGADAAPSALARFQRRPAVRFSAPPRVLGLINRKQVIIAERQAHGVSVE